MPFSKKSIALPSDFNLPQRLRRLAELAYNLWWTWGKDADQLFKLVDEDRWESTQHNPVKFLRLVELERLIAASRDRHYLEIYDRVLQAFNNYMSGVENAWYARHYPERINQHIAYFSAEYGLHESLPIYSGGLGVLAGDYLKEASDLGMPLVAIGLFYEEGYFVQRIAKDGRQEAQYVKLLTSDLPLFPVLDGQGRSVTITIDMPGRVVNASIWRVQVGRAPLFLLDSNIKGNRPFDRKLTARLYASDPDLRISQEIILGIGGVRAIRALGYSPTVWHMNEGHSAFLALELARELTVDGYTFGKALDEIIDSIVYTTHTPVPAGHDEFPLPIIDKYFDTYWPQLNLEREVFYDLARNTQPWGEMFNMAILALRMSGQRNAVSELHGHVARKMWSYLWPDKPVDEVPIRDVTNGVHARTWLAQRIMCLYDKYLDPDWLEHLDDAAEWEGVKRIPDEGLWEVRCHLKCKLVTYVRELVRQAWLEKSIHPKETIAGGALLDPYSLTIGFARRFTTYKRANLIFHDLERLLSLVNCPGKPVQVIIAGKAHPADEPAKRIIQEIYQQVSRNDCGGRIIFLEEYDMNLARYLVQGVDVWLNTPRRPNEASGTSGQKAAINGVLNFSVLDGWWREGFDGSNGWAIGEDRDYEDQDAQDASDAMSLYQTLEEEIVPLFYTRSSDDVPREWLERVKHSITTLAPRFNMRRMVKEYISEMYLPVFMEQ